MSKRVSRKALGSTTKGADQLLRQSSFHRRESEQCSTKGTFISFHPVHTTLVPAPRIGFPRSLDPRPWTENSIQSRRVNYMGQNPIIYPDWPHRLNVGKNPNQLERIGSACRLGWDCNRSEATGGVACNQSRDVQSVSRCLQASDGFERPKHVNAVHHIEYLARGPEYGAQQCTADILWANKIPHSKEEKARSLGWLWRRELTSHSNSARIKEIPDGVIWVA
ncbi:hypothetical protein FB451DRAFT_1178521 [Mycena latifolia]|nr:hypothetical protein FB451DRAFT_1178521 [Mycena latifolia]